MGWPIAVAAIGSAVLGAMSAKQGSDAQIKAANASRDAQLAMYNQSRQDMMPYMQYGQNALGTPEYGRGAPIYGTKQILNPSRDPNNIKLDRNGNRIPTSNEPQYLTVEDKDNITGYEQGEFRGYKEGTGIRPGVLNAGDYQLQASQQVGQFQAPEGSQLPTYNSPSQFQAGQNTALSDFKFELNPDDPIYQWKQKQMEDSINRAAAARGNYNSRAAINALSEGNMALAAQEMDSQYGRQLTEHGLGNQLADTRYGAADGRIPDGLWPGHGPVQYPKRFVPVRMEQGRPAVWPEHAGRPDQQRAFQGRCYGPI
jgi:hypothetical protein